MELGFVLLSSSLKCCVEVREVCVIYVLCCVVIAREENPRCGIG